MNISRLTASNKATIPAKVRGELGLRVGDRLAWKIEENGTVTARRVEDRNTYFPHREKSET